MKLFLTCPSLARHGGIRVILEWANRLDAAGHSVILRVDDARRDCDWFPIASGVRISHSDRDFFGSECAVICSPHGIRFLQGPGPARRFVFMQMAEHLFRPNDRKWLTDCNKFYDTPYPIISISRWNEQFLRARRRKGAIHYVGNGVNLDHFPISHKPKDGKTVLVEGWAPGNATKDANRFAARVCKKLRDEGFTILAYTQKLKGKDDFHDVPHELWTAPTLEELNELYERATILVKATKFDARSCAPMEAMTKGTVTARAIMKGDDDLVNNQNCLRVGYNALSLYDASKRLLTDDPFRERLAENCRKYVQEFSWDYWMDKIRPILVGEEAARVA